MLLASHAAIAIDQARLFEDSRELALVHERARLARELHDAMSQSLFGLRLAAEAAGRLLESDPSGRRRTGRHRAELAARDRPPSCGRRSRACGPPTSSATGWSPRSRAQLAVAGRAHGVPSTLEAGELRRARPRRRAPGPAGRPGGGEPTPCATPSASRVTVTLGTEGGLGSAAGTLVLRVVDDGAGFDPEARAVPGPAPGPDLDARAGRGAGRDAARSTRRRARAPRSSCGCRGRSRRTRHGRREPARPIRVVVCDDHPVVRQGLRSFLEAQGFAVVGEAADGAEAVRLVAEHAARRAAHRPGHAGRRRHRGHPPDPGSRASRWGSSC